MIKYIDEYRDADLCQKMAEKIRGISNKPFNIMEVCGGHTMAIRKNGINKLLGDNINLISGPGCPVCVTSIGDIDKAIALANIKDTIICTFGDMVYVPGTRTALAEEKAGGADIRTVYSVYDALNLAKQEKDKEIVFIAIGFETTAPSTAAAIQQAKKEAIKNFSALCLHKTMPKALRAVLSDKDSKIQALLCPGHVSTITGLDIYKFIVEELNVSCCVSGFEPLDIFRSIYTLTKLYEEGKVDLVNQYQRAVRPQGNEKAKNIMRQVFEPGCVEWRGFGRLEDSGLKINRIYEGFDAEKRFNIKVTGAKENPACLCGDILRGKNIPTDCALYNTACTPLNPKGACMVSSEGTCAAWYKYSSDM